MRREIIITADGSSSIHLPEWNENYHSKHGAIQEAYHVFMKMGLFHFLKTFKSKRPVHLLEIGFGTGLNAFITFLEAKKLKVKIDYTAVEAYPILLEEIEKLNYAEQLSGKNLKAVFQKIHELPWGKKHCLDENFHLTKQQKLFQEIEEHENFDVIFFDAFGPEVQPELWTETVFSKMYRALKSNGILTTYSAKGSVRRAMQAAGFQVEKIPGPPGKREMLRAVKS